MENISCGEWTALGQSDLVRVLLPMENWFYRLLNVFINAGHNGALNLYSGCSTGD